MCEPAMEPRTTATAHLSAPDEGVGARPDGTPAQAAADDGAAWLLILRPPVPLEVLQQALRDLAAARSVHWRL